MTNQLPLRFKQFAEDECKNSSKLYEHLALNIANDEEIIELCSDATIGQPIPNLLLGSVHYLLLRGKKHTLKEFYPSLVKKTRDINESFVYFKDFCHQYRNEIINLLKTKIVQTNEVRRCAYLYPSFSYIYQKINKPISLIEIGTSAGLQLLWDQYQYSYNSSQRYGNRSSTLHIQSEVKNHQAVPLLKNSPPVIDRIGLDLYVNDLSIEEDCFWLKALIWPEHMSGGNFLIKLLNVLKNIKFI